MSPIRMLPVSDDRNQTSTHSIGIGGKIQDRLLIFENQTGRCKMLQFWK